MANDLDFWYMLTVLEQTLLVYQTQHRPDFHYSEALISQFLSEGRDVYWQIKLEMNLHNLQTFLLVYFLTHTIKFPFHW